MFPSRGSKIAIYVMTSRMALEQWERPAAERSFKRRFADFHYRVFVFLFGTIRDHGSCYTCERDESPGGRPTESVHCSRVSGKAGQLVYGR